MEIEYKDVLNGTDEKRIMCLGHMREQRMDAKVHNVGLGRMKKWGSISVENEICGSMKHRDSRKVSRRR